MVRGVWMGSVDIPDELVRAHREDRLVFFVGAGASVDPPSALPLFVPLAERIAREVGHVPTDEERERPDWLLGELDDGAPDVHLQVWSILTGSPSEPNDLHRAIVDLAGAGGVSPRVVTTNYDRHLSTVLRAYSMSTTEYMAPALPVGDDFEGIVYLHGSLDQEPRRLVVTDRDFGRAYLTDAWAARFLERMFRSYTALFIGYSHSDVVMRYLARALTPNAKRFVLAQRGSASDWDTFGITPVWYELDAGSHRTLTVTVQKWATRASMNMLDHQQRIASLVQARPTGIPEETSYLESVLGETATVAMFAQVARDPAWLDWASTRPEFHNIFDPAAPQSEVSHTLAWWYAEHFVAVEAHHSHAFELLRDRGGQLGPAGVNAIGQRCTSSVRRGRSGSTGGFHTYYEPISHRTCGGSMPSMPRDGPTTGRALCCSLTTSPNLKRTSPRGACELAIVESGCTAEPRCSARPGTSSSPHI
jgi:hypothetical protein